MLSQTFYHELRASAGVVFRALVDVLCVLTAFVFGWLVAVDHTADLLLAHFDITLLVSVCLGISVVAFYGAAGMYTRVRSLMLREKFRRMVIMNLAYFLAAGTVWFIVARATGLPGGEFQTITSLVVVAFTVATVLVSLARASSAVLRFENVQDTQASSLIAPLNDDDDLVLVVGGCGYIGSRLVEILLNKGKKVMVLDAMHFGTEPLDKVSDHPNLTIVREDFRHVEALTRAMHGVNSVIHLGGLVGDPACAVDPELTIDMNVTATKLVGEIAKASGVRRFIFASSCSVYGSCDEIVDETSPFNPQSLYAKTKVASEAVLSPLNDDNFAVTHLRFATVYGISGRVRFDLVVNLLCAKAVRDGVITVFGPDQWRPFVHVQDVARAIAVTLEAPIDLVAGDVFNVGSDAQNYTLGEAAELINQQVSDAEIVADLDFADKRNYRVSFKKIRERLDFEPAWTLEAGIEQVVDIVRSNHVGHYSLPTYSNVLRLKECGPKSFASFQITGWEHEFMNGNTEGSGARDGQPFAA
ncbi:MAG: SDR family oxidoreductase [Hyphomicrobiales bacterium]|nr:SDR family oxidoreductase [Hyphomicrobiales bacterium]